MSNPLCQLLTISIVRPTLKINVLKMEQAFFTSYREGERAFCVSSTNWKGEEEKVGTYIDTWSSLQKENNAEFGKFLVEDPIFCWFFGKCFTFGTIIITFKLGDRTLMRTIPTNPTNTSRLIHLFWTQQMDWSSYLQL